MRQCQKAQVTAGPSAEAQERAIAQADGVARTILSLTPPKGVGETMTMSSVVERLQALVKRAAAEDGQALVEYALLISLIAIVAFGAVDVFGLGVSQLFSKIVSVYP
jgi:Flp pilus assembly pilin Flp